MFSRLFLMRVIDIPYLNMSGPDRKSYTHTHSYYSQYTCSVSFKHFTVCVCVQCSPKEIMSCTSRSLKSGRPATCTSSSAPSVTHTHTHTHTHSHLYVCVCVCADLSAVSQGTSRSRGSMTRRRSCVSVRRSRFR